MTEQRCVREMTQTSPARSGAPPHPCHSFGGGCCVLFHLSYTLPPTAFSVGLKKHLCARCPDLKSRVKNTSDAALPTKKTTEGTKTVRKLTPTAGSVPARCRSRTTSCRPIYRPPPTLSCVQTIRPATHQSPLWRSLKNPNPVFKARSPCFAT